MMPKWLADAARALLALCVAVAALEYATDDGRMASLFRGLCALAAGVCLVRGVMAAL